MRLILYFLSVVTLLGCIDQPPQKTKWTPQVLTEAQEERQEELLEELYPALNWEHSLEGKPADVYSEFLSLADRIGSRDKDTYYVFDVISGGDVHEPSELPIVVSGGKITYAKWPSAEF